MSNFFLSFAEILNAENGGAVTKITSNFSLDKISEAASNALLGP